MLSYEMINMLAIGGTVGITLGAGSVFAFLNRKNVNVPETLGTLKEALNVAKPVIQLAEKIVPNNKVVETVAFIEHWTENGVQKAEQLYHNNKLNTDEERRGAAKETVYTALNELNIEPTENQKKLIDDIIEASTNKLGHKDKTDTEKEAEKQALQVKVSQLTKERDVLKNTISQINATTASTVQSA